MKFQSLAYYQFKLIKINVILLLVLVYWFLIYFDLYDLIGASESL